MYILDLIKRRITGKVKCININANKKHFKNMFLKKCWNYLHHRGVAHCQPHRDDVAQGDTAGKVKMADQSGTELSEEKEAEIELKKRQKRTWEGLHKSGKIGITPELPETLGFYDISAVRREQRKLSAGNCRVALLITLRRLKCFQLIWGGGCGH